MPTHVPNLNPSTFLKKTKIIYKKADAFRSQQIKKVVELVKKAHCASDNSPVNGFTDISVSFDGSWLTRGHTSKIGLGCVIDVLTDYVIDYHVMSLHCQVCATIGKKMMAKGKAEHEKWKKAHVLTSKVNKLIYCIFLILDSS